jgi:hypothetical protein
MSEIGSIIKSMDLEFSIMRTAINIKAGGQLISVMAKEPSGLQTQKINSEDSILAIGRMILNKVVEQCSIRKGTDMTECGWITCLMAKEE